MEGLSLLGLWTEQSATQEADPNSQDVEQSETNMQDLEEGEILEDGAPLPRNYKAGPPYPSPQLTLIDFTNLDTGKKKAQS